MNRGWMVSVVISVMLFGFLHPVGGETRQLPEWFRFSVGFAETPQIGKSVDVVATLSALIGDLTDIRVRLLLPPSWSPASPSAELGRLASGTSRAFRFQVQTAGALPNGSVGCSMQAKTPKAALAGVVSGASADETALMKKQVQGLPDETQTFADIAFALFPEEGFYPLGLDMWLVYVDFLTPKSMIRGPALYRESMISAFQAQTDVEMYQKLEGLMEKDPRVVDSLKVSGIDLSKKRQDYALAQYVLALESLLKKNYPDCLKRLELLEKTWKALPEARQADLKVAAGNLKGVCLWASGDRRAAEDAFRGTFYQNRKLPVQRYTLRNLGLLCFDRGDLANGREMLRLALEMKSGYSLLQEEMKLLKKP